MNIYVFCYIYAGILNVTFDRFCFCYIYSGFLLQKCKMHAFSSKHRRFSIYKYPLWVSWSRERFRGLHTRCAYVNMMCSSQTLSGIGVVGERRILVPCKSPGIFMFGVKTLLVLKMSPDRDPDQVVHTASTMA